MDPGEKTMAEVFRDNGYRTGCFGKWHNGAHYPYTPNAQGFDEFTGFKAGHWSNYFNTTLDHNGDTLKTDGFITDVLTDRAIGFIQQNQQRPFFCYIPYNAPHTPYQVRDKYYNRFINKLNIPDEKENRKRSTIYGMVENLDYNIGRLLDKLKELKLLDNTIVIFLTDNGPNGNRFNGYMRGKKGSVHEGGVRVPCFIYWKGRINGGKVLSGSAAHIDLLPTLVGLCNLTFQNHRPIDGIDLSGYLLDPSKNELPEREIFTHQNQGTHVLAYPGAVRTNKYRLIVTGDNKYNLFDMKNDPGEIKDISDQKAELSQELYDDYENWLNEVRENAMKDRRIPIGYDESPVTALPAHEALITSGLSYKANAYGWAHDWLIDWDSTKDTISWKLDVVAGGTYEIFLQYNCRKENVGSEIKAAYEEESVNKKLDIPFHSDILPYHDRVIREAEAFEKNWKLFPVGRISMEKGVGELHISAVKIPAGKVAELKGAVIKKLISN